MTRRRTPPAPTATDSVLRAIVESDEYKAALKTRMLAGKASATELSLARDLGMVVAEGDGLDDRRAALRALSPDVRRTYADLARLIQTGSSRLRVIRAGSIVGLGYDTNAVPVYQTPEPTLTEPQTEIDELLPRKVQP